MPGATRSAPAGFTWNDDMPDSGDASHACGTWRHGEGGEQGSAILLRLVAVGLEARLGRVTSSRGHPSASTDQMSVLAPAVGAFLAAVIESSVLTHLQVGSIRPDLVFAVGIAVAMVLGFESGMTWAFVGGLTLDLLLPGRALGSTALGARPRDRRRAAGGARHVAAAHLVVAGHRRSS